MVEKDDRRTQVQGRLKGILKKLYGCFKGVTGYFKEVPRIFYWCFMGALTLTGRGSQNPKSDGGGLDINQIMDLANSVFIGA